MFYLVLGNTMAFNVFSNGHVHSANNNSNITSVETFLRNVKEEVDLDTYFCYVIYHSGSSCDG